MKMYLGSINEKVWDVMKNDFVILHPTNPTPREKENKQSNTMVLNTIYNAIDSKVFEQIKDLERAAKFGQDWIKPMKAHRRSRVPSYTSSRTN